MDWHRLEALRAPAPPIAAAEVRPSIRDFTQYLGSGRAAVAIVPVLGAPSPGDTDRPDVVALARALDDLEVPALAVATAPGSARLDDVAAVAAAVAAPVLRWDCVAGEDRLYESRLAGADAVLVPVTVAADALPRLIALARAIHVTAVVEIATEAERATALAAGAPVIAVAAGAVALAAAVPPRVPVLAQEAIASAADVIRLRGLVDGLLLPVPPTATALERVRAFVDAAAALEP